MALPTHILLTYGYLLLFAWVLVEQLGIPLPATPVLRAAGGLVFDAAGRPLRYGKTEAEFRNGPFVAWGDPKAAIF